MEDVRAATVRLFGEMVLRFARGRIVVTDPIELESRPYTETEAREYAAERTQQFETILAKRNNCAALADYAGPYLLLGYDLILEI